MVAQGANFCAVVLGNGALAEGVVLAHLVYVDEAEMMKVAGGLVNRFENPALWLDFFRHGKNLSGRQLVALYQHIRRNLQAFSKVANHFQRQRPYAIEHFGHAGA